MLLGFFFPQVGIGTIQPVFARRIKDIHIQRVFQSHCAVGKMWRDYQHFTSPHNDLFLLIFSEQEFQCSFQNICDLLVFVS